VVPQASLRDIERRNILNALARCDHRIAGEAGAAKALGISPSTLAYRMKRLGIDPKHRRHESREGSHEDS